MCEPNKQELLEKIEKREMRAIVNGADVFQHRMKSRRNQDKKANHKHNYVEVLFVGANYKGSPNIYHRGTRCSICGKMGECYWVDSQPTGPRSVRLLTPEEMWNKYKHLPKYPLHPENLTSS